MAESESYCREIEAYLCRKNDGHLIRIVGPAFDLVGAWAREGIPLAIACAGIDRYFERYYRKGRRRWPVRVEFCDADVRDAFDEWRRAVGVHTGSSSSDRDTAPAAPRRSSLTTHLDRAIARLTALRGSTGAPAALAETLAQAVRVLDEVRAAAPAARGRVRDGLIDRLRDLDRTLGDAAAAALDEPTRARVDAEAREAVAPFRGRMADAAYAHALDTARDRAVRLHFGLPTLTFE